jgi:hypothetical protein
MLSVQNAMTEFMKDEPLLLVIVNSFPSLGANCDDVISVFALPCKSAIISFTKSNNEIKINCV